MRKSVKQTDNESFKKTFYEFISENERSFNTPTNDKFTTTYQSKGNSIILSIDDTHPSHGPNMGGYRQKITINNTVRITIIHTLVKRNFFGINKYKKEEVIYNLKDEIEENLVVNSLDTDLFHKIKTLRNKYFENFNDIRSGKVKSQEDLKVRPKENNLIRNLNEKKLQQRRLDFLSKYDNDFNGKIDLIESKIFEKLLQKHQNTIDEFHSDGVYNLVRVGKLIKQRETILQSIVRKYLKHKEMITMRHIEKLFENVFKEYSLLLFNGVNLIVSILNNDKITFYKIYDTFESLGVFQSSYEKSVIENGKLIINELKKVNLNLEYLKYSLDSLEDGLSSLNYSLENLNNTLETELQEIKSSIRVGNFINMINTYQVYKINKNTKSLKP